MLQVVARRMQPASQPTRVSQRETRRPERFRGGGQPEGRRRVSPPPSPPREERPVVPQPGIEQVAQVRLEIIGIGEEDEILELEELVEDGAAGREEAERVEDGEIGVDAPILGPQERRVRGVAAGERGGLADRLDPEVPGPQPGPLV